MLHTPSYDMAAAAVAGLTTVERDRTNDNPEENTVELITDLWNLLAQMNILSLIENMVTNIIVTVDVFDPRNILPRAISIIGSIDKISTNVQFLRLWEHSANALLTKSEYPPEQPKDWKQVASCRCKCIYCNELMKFVQDSKTQTHRFRLPQDDRSHLEHTIFESRLDMERSTETKGRPYTLVCTKTRAIYEKQCIVHQCDLKGMQMLLNVMNPSATNQRSSLTELQHRLIKANKRGLGGSNE
jgi:hypothetical protein